MKETESERRARIERREEVQRNIEFLQQKWNSHPEEERKRVYRELDEEDRAEKWENA